MLRRILLIVSISVSTLILGSAGVAFAEQSVPVNIQGGGAADLLNVTNVPSALDGSRDDSGVHLYCTDSYGRVFQKTDPAFEDCLAQKRKASAPASPTPRTPKSLLNSGSAN
jgi:hypothetical protein